MTASPKTRKIDYLIVGQGLAGSLVAYQLIKEKKEIVVIDQPSRNCSSRVAAAMFNPVTGQNLVKSWLTDTVFPFLHQFYPELERATGRSFFKPTPIYRPFGTIQEQNEWMGRSADPFYLTVLDRIETTSQYPELDDPYGGLVLKGGGYLDLPALLDGTRHFIESNATYIDEKFVHSELEILPEGVRYGDFEADFVIFCEGVGVVENPWFNRLPIRRLKGEILEIKSDFGRQVIVNKGVYMVPGEGAKSWRVGSTYNLKEPTPEVTSKGRAEIEEKLSALLNIPFEIIDQSWGIRPTTVDRRPMIGSHPKYPCLVLFNGLGTKGVSLAPYFSELLIHWLKGSRTLIPEVDVTRYKSLY